MNGENSMGKDSKKKMKIQSQEALQVVQAVIDDADQALKDTSRKMKDSQLGKVTATTGMLTVGGTIGSSIAGFRLGAVGATAPSALTLSSLLASPVVVLGGIGIGVASHIKNKKMQEAKELLYKDAIAKQNAILKALNEEKNADKERIEYLTQINILLKEAIEDLRNDLGGAPC